MSAPGPPSSTGVTVGVTLAATLTLDGHEIALAGTGSSPGWAMEATASLAGAIDLRDLPLVGRVLPATGEFGLAGLQVALPVAGPQAANGSPTQTAAIRGTLTLGSEAVPLALVLGGAGGGVSTAFAAEAGAPPSLSGAYWVTVQKSFGPFSIGRVGVRYAGGVVSLLFDAGLTAAGLTLSLEGLSIGSKLEPFSPVFDLQGLGLDFERGPLEIGGAFLRESDGAETEYDGLAVIRAKSLCLSAMGSYAVADGHPSLFVYAFLDFPIGGPSFFFVTGLAAGFGAHRNLVLPAIGDVATFPLVAEATQGLTAPPSGLTGADPTFLAEELAKLHAWIPIDPEEDFFAVGVRFTTFELIDSFALLAVKLGRHFEVVVLGLSTLVVPTPKEGQTESALAVAQMELLAWFDPSAGVLAVQAQLTSASYVLSRDCHLTGGFALYSWFSGEHAGDFVQTLGGYHPDFVVPSHYPVVPRLGFQWVLDSHISLQGSLYYALTAHALMAGGALDAVFHAGPIRAWFIAGADFLIAWKPYHYEADVHVDMGVSFTFHLFGTHHITVDLSVDLEIWGPSFSGRAHVHLWIVTFTISFGSASRAPQPIPWSEFKSSFLPSLGGATGGALGANDDPPEAGEQAVCSVAVTGGLVKTARNQTLVTTTGTRTVDVWLVNPKDFRLVSSTLIPCTEVPQLDGAGASAVPGTTPNYGVDVAPVGGQTGLTSRHDVTITPLGGSKRMLLASVPVLRRAPAALWGRSLGVDLNGPRFIEDAVCGCEVTPGAEPTPGTTCRIPRENLRFDDFPFNIPPGYPVPSDRPGPVPWEPLPEAALAPVSSGDPSTIDQGLVGAAARRTALLQGFGVAAPEVDVLADLADVFSVVPRITQWTFTREAP